MNGMIPPLNVTQLNARLAHVAAELGIPVARARVMLCTLIVSQMLPDAVAVKGGMGLKLRFGERGTRATSDLDVSARLRGEEFEQVFGARLAAGWGRVPASKGERRRNPDAPERVAFTATVRAVKLHDPGLARPEYVIHPYRVSIAFLGEAWGGLDVEVTDPAYVRAHDLVDLQLLWSAAPELSSLHGLCLRTFNWRRQQVWPPLPLRPMDGWDLAYTDARSETEIDGRTPVLPNVTAARHWLEQIIDLIASSPARPR